MLDGVPRPDHGTGYVERVCTTCSASWVGTTTDACGWCIARTEALIADTRRDLLRPPWLASDAGDPRYDRLDADTRAVWDHTRGQTRGAGSLAAWAARIERAVSAGLITRDEAVRAVRRMRRDGDR